MNPASIPVLIMASISFYVGFYHLLIYFRRRQHREDLTFALLCLVTSFYDVFCIGLYNSSTVAEGVQWQRAQLIALAFFTTAFLWFVCDYTHQKPGRVLYAFSAFYVLAIFIQLVDRSSLTWVVDSPSIKEILISSDLKIVYYEALFGPFTTIQSLMGLVASTYILVSGLRFYRRGYKREAGPLLVAIVLMYAAAFNDTAVANSLYQFVYAIEYGYMAMILLMAYSLSNTVVEAAMAKEAWRASEERFRALVEATSDWVWEMDQHGVYTYASPKVSELLGYVPREIIGKTPFDLMPPAEAQRVRVLFQEFMDTPRPIERLENTAQHQDGRLVVLETSGMPFFDAHGKLLGYRGIDRDITERKRAEEALRESEERFRLFMQHFPGLAYIKDAATRVLFANQGFVDYLNVAPAAILGKTNQEVFPAEFAQQITADDQRVLDSGASEVIEEHYAGRIWSTYKFVISQTDKPALLGGFTLDITERKRSEEALHESESIFRSFVEQTSEGIMLLDEQGSVVEWNHAVELVTGIPREEVLGKPAWEFQFRLLPDMRKSPAAYERLKANYLDILRSGISPWQDRPLEAVFQRADGTERIVEQRLFPIKTSKGFSLGGASRDITDRKRAEETLQMFQYTIDRASDAVQWLTREAGFEYVNDQACRSLGYTREELMHLHLWDIDPVYPQERWDKNWESYQDGRIGGSETVETLHRRKDGSVFPVEVLSNHLWFGDRELHVAVVRDITERKQAEAQVERTLHETRVRFEVSQALAGAETEDQVLDMLIQHAGLYLQAFVAIFTFDRRGDELVAIVRRQSPFESGLTAAMSIGEGLPASRYTLFGYFSADQPFVSNDVWADERFEPAGREILGRTGVASFAAIPLTAGNEWIGYIGAMAKPAGYFDEEKRHLYQTLAEQGAVALRAAHLRETIRESQQRLTLLVQQSPLGVIEWNTDLQVVSWNPAAERIFGYPREEALGRHATYLAVPEETQLLLVQGMLARTGSITGTYDHVTKDGRRITCEWFSAPLVGADGQVIGVVSLVHDVTERKRAEEALREKTAELDRYFTNALDLLCIADTDGYFRRLNKEWESALGYPIQELEGTRFLDYVHPADLEATLEAISKLGEQKEVLNFVNRYRSKDGSYRWIEWRSSPVGKMIYAVARDITERKQAEAEREKLIADLEAKNAELERFTYTVSHDLKAPLITIRGFLGFLEKDARSGNLDRLQTDLRRISDATDKMQRLLNELLELSRIGRLMNPPEAVPFDVIAREAIELVRGRLEACEVRMNLAPDLPTVYGDRARLVEVVQNLVDNACKFMGDQAAPQITIGCSGTDQDDMPILFVQDNGIGIDPQYHHKVFGLFDKLDPQAEGTGIGLALVKRIVEVHGGRIWVESAGAQTGTTFCFTLPIRLKT